MLITRRTRKDGSLVDVELLGLPITVEGQNIGMLAMVTTISPSCCAPARKPNRPTRPRAPSWLP